MKRIFHWGRLRMKLGGNILNRVMGIYNRAIKLLLSNLNLDYICWNTTQLLKKHYPSTEIEGVWNRALNIQPWSFFFFNSRYYYKV